MSRKLKLCTMCGSRLAEPKKKEDATCQKCQRFASEIQAECCANCTFYLASYGELEVIPRNGRLSHRLPGRCVRFPPAVVVDGREHRAHPTVHQYDWCGEWKSVLSEYPMGRVIPLSSAAYGVREKIPGWGRIR